MAEEKNTNTGFTIDGEQSSGFFPKGKNYLLVIGIDQYENFPRLYNAVKDAEEVVDILIQYYQFEKEDTTVLLDQDATQSNIFKALDNFAGLVTSDDNLLIYFSGHGEYKEVLDTGFWIPVDANAGNVGSFLQFGMLQLYIKAIKSHHTVLIADSCYAGSMFTTRSSGSYKDRLESRPSRWLITAGRNEVVADGKPGMNSPFADAVLFTLRENKDKRLKIAEFADEVAELVTKNASQTPQYAEMFGVDSKGGQFMFRLKAFAKTAFETVRTKPKEEIVVETFRSTERQVETYQSEKEVVADGKKLLAKDRVEEAFQLMQKVILPDHSMYDNIIHLQSRFSSYINLTESGEYSEKELSRKLNGIKRPFMTHLNDLEEEKAINEAIFGKLERVIFEEKAIKPPKQKTATNLGALEKTALQQEAEQLIDQIAFFRKEMNSAYDSAKKYSLSKDIEAKEKRLNEIKEQLGE